MNRTALVTITPFLPNLSLSASLPANKLENRAPIKAEVTRKDSWVVERGGRGVEFSERERSAPETTPVSNPLNPFNLSRQFPGRVQ